jgi:2-polyprenyl-3-methyl-5-hydroxy-6-metoxy-1,4-benzoquinol methylase
VAISPGFFHLYLALKHFVPEQVEYYNHFALANRELILSCPEPEFWTTDYQEKGRVYREMLERIEQQRQLIATYFNKQDKILDIGCGFGRQACMLARNGYKVVGTDTSNAFIKIAEALFDKHGYSGEFVCTDITSENKISGSYRQVLLLDVLEHIRTSRRGIIFKKLHELSSPGATLIVSLPHVKKRLSSQLNNRVRRAITQHFAYFMQKEEHPYPVPGKSKIIKLAKGYFVLNAFVNSAATDYYVFNRE